MAKYRVMRPWHGVAVGDVIETDRLHPAIKPNVEPWSEGILTPATPSATTEKVEAAAPNDKPKRRTKAVKSDDAEVK